MRDYAKGLRNDELTNRINAEFGTHFTVKQVKNCKERNNILSGFDGRFKKGSSPWNKGLKGWCPKGAEKGHFPKGGLPPTTRPMWSERIDRDGYTYIKTDETKKWELKHRWIYEQAHGELPRGTAVIFLDGDKSNFDLSNLKAVTRAELAIMCHEGMFSDCPEITESNLYIAKLKIATVKARKDKEK